MTDKQIIIDCVDVSEWTDEEVYYKFEQHSPKAIRQIAFDLYKQLKAKEQECEQLKNLFKGVQKSLKVENEECSKWSQLETEARYALLRKEQECEELKEEKQGLIKDWEEKKNLAYEIACKNEKFKQTLAEIKTDILDIRVGISYFWVTDKCDEILQKISEVEDD